MIIQNLPNYLVHITHNDADAIGCALVVDKYAAQKRRCDFVERRDYQVNHKFFSVSFANDVLDLITNTLLSLIEYNTNNDSSVINEDDLNDYKTYLFGTDIYAQVDPVCIPDAIFITDLSIKSSILDKLETVSKYFKIKLIYVDHHETSVINNQKYDWCYVETVDNDGKPRAACKLFMDRFIFDKSDEWCFKYDSLHDLINDISRYDTWLWKTEPKTYPVEDYTKVLINAYGSAWSAYEHISVMFKYVTEDLRDVPEFDAYIVSDRIKRKSYFNRYLPNTVYCMGYELGFNDPLYATSYFALIILPENYGNDIMEEIYTKSERDIDVVIGLYPSSRSISLRRGFKSNIDLSALASKYGGGGHVAAAGASCDTETFMKFLTKYYTLLDNKNNKV